MSLSDIEKITCMARETQDKSKKTLVKTKHLYSLKKKSSYFFFVRSCTDNKELSQSYAET